MPNPFESVNSLKPGRSAFDLSHEVKMTGDMGKLYPIFCEEGIPSDVFDINVDAILRMQPLVAPVLHEINVFFHFFFVPYRILDDTFEDFITGGADGNDATVLPRWSPTKNGKGSLWDYLGLPVGVVPTGALPLDHIRRAYNRIYNEYYRDQNLIDPIDEDNEDILIRAWEKDYFTCALPWQQRGDEIALPISGTSKAIWPDSTIQPIASVPNQYPIISTATGDGKLYAPNNDPDFVANLRAFFAANSVDLSSASTFDVADMRYIFAIQHFQERQARGGARYTETLRSHFGISPRDDRLQRPEYIGGSRMPVIVSEVLQTSSSDATSPQGNLAGHGITVGSGRIGRYRVQEYGVIMGIMSIMPRSAYQQGIERMWLKKSRLEFVWPEFVNLSEQAVLRAELYATNVEAENLTEFGFVGRYDEYRVRRNKVVAGMRDDFDYWHIGRQFGSAPALNKSFIECVPRKDIFATPSEDGFIVSVGNKVRAVRPLPVLSTPGLMDHN